MFKNFTLLRSQRNRVYELLRENGLEAAEFSWAKEEIAGSLVVSRLNYRGGEYYFQFTSHEVNSWCTACPGQFRSLDHEYPKNWEEQEAVLKKWLQCLKREIAAPDPWDQLAKYKIVFGIQALNGTLNEAIGAAEAEGIGQGLSRLGEAIVRDLKLSREEAAMVQGKLDYLAEAARRQRSQDWTYTAIGVCAGISAALALTEGTAGSLWRVCQKEVGQFIHLTTAPDAAAAPKNRVAVVDPASHPAARQEESRKFA